MSLHRTPARLLLRQREPRGGRRRARDREPPAPWKLPGTRAKPALPRALQALVPDRPLPGLGRNAHGELPGTEVAHGSSRREVGARRSGAHAALDRLGARNEPISDPRDRATRRD